MHEIAREQRFAAHPGQFGLPVWTAGCGPRRCWMIATACSRAVRTLYANVPIGAEATLDPGGICRCTTTRNRSRDRVRACTKHHLGRLPKCIADPTMNDLFTLAWIAVGPLHPLLLPSWPSAHRLSPTYAPPACRVPLSFSSAHYIRVDPDPRRCVSQHAHFASSTPSHSLALRPPQSEWYMAVTTTVQPTAHT